MDCVNHSGVSATAYCQNCGKAICASCVRDAGNGQILCEPCWTSWQGFQQPFVAPPAGTPNPSVAMALGFIPGVGAMYNGQYFKGLIHVVIFVVIISITTHYGLFGLFIPAWILYQSFEAFHTAKAIRDGQPLPDPLGLNEVGNWMNLGGRPQAPFHPGAGPSVGPTPTGFSGTGAYGAGQYGTGPAGTGTAGTGPAPPNPAAGYQQVPYPGQYQAPFTPAAGFPDPAIPPIPPVPPLFWKRKEPIGALILIGFGLILLLNQMGYLAERVFHLLWPTVFIALGVWLIIRRVGDSKGGAQ
jgi:hypothetical protein